MGPDYLLSQLRAHLSHKRNIASVAKSNKESIENSNENKDQGYRYSYKPSHKGLDLSRRVPSVVHNHLVVDNILVINYILK